MQNRLFYGDCLAVMKENVWPESVDFVYADPPFNSARDYNVIFGRADRHDELGTAAQIQAFGDTWVWSPATDIQYSEIINGGNHRVADAVQAFRSLLGENDATSYLVNMAPRLVEAHRALKRTGYLALHCDPTMSHYLKVLLDGIFGADNLVNEIVWQRTGSKSLMTKRLPTNHDVLLVYRKSAEAEWRGTAAFIPYDEDDLPDKTAAKYYHRDDDGRRYRLDSLINPNADRPNLTYEFLGVTRVWRWTKTRMQAAYDAGIVIQTAPGRVPQLKRYLDEQRGLPLSDVWGDIFPLNSQAAERLGYPTQKPLALLERLLALMTDPGDVLLDPFCGCGTSVDAAEKMGRSWVGIDITYIAVDLIDKRLKHTYGDGIADTYVIEGIPRDLAAALALFSKSPFDFERWAVSLVHAQPNERQVGDRGIDGVARFPVDARGSKGRILVSVKGGRQLNPAMVRDLIGTVESQKAEMGILITMHPLTRGMVDAINHGGTYSHPANGQTFPRIQALTVAELLQGQRPVTPITDKPYIQASKRAASSETESLF